MMRWLVIVAIAFAFVPLRGEAASVKRQRAERSAVRPEYDIRAHKPVDDAAAAIPFDRSIVNESRLQNYGTRASALPPPPPSPGRSIGFTSYEYQHNQSQGYQVARTPGADIVHFVWTAYDIITGDCQWEECRFVAYSSFRISTNALNQPYGGVFLSDNDERGGYPNITVDDSNKAHVYLHKRQLTSAPFHPYAYLFPAPGSAYYQSPVELTGTEPYCSEVLWPHGATARDAGSLGVPLHVVAHNGNPCSRDLVWYWRFDGATWTGPVIIDSNFTLGYVVTDDPNSNQAAIALHTDREASLNGINNIAYYESNTGGLDWIDGTGLGDANKSIITNYNSTTGPQAYLHISTAYDNSGALHIVWDEQRYANQTADASIRHWNDARGTIRTVAIGYWQNDFSNGAYDLNLSKLTLGIGDGSTQCQGGAESNDDYLYVVHTRFGGPSQAEQDDHSYLGFNNGELYLNGSMDGGLTWSPPQNLTNTKTPNCNPGPGAPGAAGEPPRPDSVCRSEHWATIGQSVTDIDILFISDLDAGGIPLGEGTWQNNRVHYLRLPGGTTDAPYVCPAVCPTMSAAMNLGYYEFYCTTPNSILSDELMIANIGNATLDVSVGVLPGAPWLIVGAPSSFSIPPAGNDVVLDVSMAADSLAQGVYYATIRITHNDASQPNPYDIPIVLYVGESGCAPPSTTRLWTGLGLGLELWNTGRFGMPQGFSVGDLSRPDGSSSLFDASLVIAHGPQNPDTVVFHHFYAGVSDTGQNGFISISNWDLDTGWTGTGYSAATCEIATKDFAVGAIVRWVFPQHPDSSDFIFAHYSVFNRTASPMYLLVGQWIDFDVLPAPWMASAQYLNDNQASFDATRNLIYQYGHNSPAHVPSGLNDAERYSAGISFLRGPDHEIPGGASFRAEVRENIDYSHSQGPSSGFMYSRLTGPPGYEIYTPPPNYDPDLYSLMALGQTQTLGVDDTLEYVIALITDTLNNPETATPSDSTSLMKSVRKSWIWASNHGLICNCDCHADPMCDGVTNVLDVVSIIDRAFRSGPTMTDSSCFAYGTSVDGRSDVNCTGTTDIIDVVLAIDVCFRNGDPVEKYCALCVI